MSKDWIRKWLERHGWKVAQNTETGNIFITRGGRTERYCTYRAAYLAKATQRMTRERQGTKTKRQHPICEGCEARFIGCGFIRRGQTETCSDVRAYDKGYKAATEKAVNWLVNELYTDHNEVDKRYPDDVRSASYFTATELVEGFRKAMEG